MVSHRDCGRLKLAGAPATATHYVCCASDDARTDLTSSLNQDTPRFATVNRLDDVEIGRLAVKSPTSPASRIS